MTNDDERTNERTNERTSIPQLNILRFFGMTNDDLCYGSSFVVRHSSFVVVVRHTKKSLISSLIIFNCAMVCRRLSSSSSSFVFPKKSAQLCTLLLARMRARQMASGGLAISISGTTNRSEIIESRVLKICMYCTMDYPGICTNNPACSLLAILANRQQWRQFSRL